MARGYKGAFGEHVNALYIWLPLCLLFMLPFFNFRRPLSLLHLDLLVLLSLLGLAGVLQPRQHLGLGPAGLPARCSTCWRACCRCCAAEPPARGRPRPLRLLIPAPWLAVAVVFLIGFRVGLERHRLERHRRRLRGRDRRPADHRRPAPVRRLPGRQRTRRHLRAVQLRGLRALPADLRLERTLGRPARRPRGGDLLRPADGRRCCSCSAGACAAPRSASRSPTRGCPTRSRCSRSRATPTTRWWRRWCWPPLLAASYAAGLARFARGGFAALAGLTKFAPLALAPILATARPARAAACAGGSPGWRCSRPAFWCSAALAMIPALRHDSLHTIYERTLVYQGNRDSPFSIWGLYGWPVRRARRGGVRGRAGARAGVIPRRERHGRAGRGLRGDPDRRPARDGTLVLPLHPVVLRAGDRRAAGRFSALLGAGCRTRHQNLLDRLRAPRP